MAKLFNRFSIVPAFPAYTGPYTVGSIDVEYAVDDLDSPSPAPNEDIGTIQYRIFYPCQPDAKGKPIHWIPSPQRGYLSAYTRFLGAGSYLAEFISFFPRILHFITIPVYKNAPLLAPETSNNRWPVMIFSHGLAGCRNAYSHLLGSIASHGVIVIAPEHRDGSSPISYMRDVPAVTTDAEKSKLRYGKKFVNYHRIPHTPSPEVDNDRNQQLKIRLWELGLVHESLLKLDEGREPKNLNTSSVSLSMFQDQIDIQIPGKVIFAGHSFGSATITQFVKSTYYSPETSQTPKEYQPLFAPSSRSAIAKQITPETPVILLDVWCQPLRAKSTKWLWDKPFPCYAEDGPGGDALLAVESQAFFKWRVHLKTTKRLLSANPSSESFDYARKDGKGDFPQPHFYWAESSAHLSQSDFGILFQWLLRKFLAVDEAERIMLLNTRAILQLLRSRNIQVSSTSATEMELEGKNDADTKDDVLIFGTNDEVRGWKFLDTDVSDMTDVNDAASISSGVSEASSSEPAKVIIGNELVKENQMAA